MALFRLNSSSVTNISHLDQALIHAYNKASMKKYSTLSNACHGLVFFGVPNLGLRQKQLNTIVQGQPNSKLISDLVVDKHDEPSPFLKRISDDFARCCEGRYKVVTFFESQLSSTAEVNWCSIH